LVSLLFLQKTPGKSVTTGLLRPRIEEDNLEQFIPGSRPHWEEGSIQEPLPGSSGHGSSNSSQDSLSQSSSSSSSSFATSCAPDPVNKTGFGWVVQGPLTTPLVGPTKYELNSKPSWTWTREEIEREELKIRAAFMRASVDYRTKLRDLDPIEMSAYVEKEKRRLKNRERFEAYLRVRKFGCSLRTESMQARQKKEAEFLDNKIVEMTEEAKSMKDNLEKQVEKFNVKKNPSQQEIDHINKVKYWLERFPVTMKNLEESQQRKREALDKQRQIQDKMEREKTIQISCEPSVVVGQDPMSGDLRANQ